MQTDEIAKHWVLNLAINHRVPLALLFPVPNTDALNVRPVPAYDSVHYGKCLVSLFEAGLVEFTREEPARVLKGRSEVMELLTRFLDLNKDDDAQKIAAPPRIPGLRGTFGLTTVGGQVWERTAEPDWTRLVMESSDLISCDLASPDRDRLMAYMGWYQEISKSEVEFETIKTSVEFDFQAMYWKRLPVVHCASFKLKPAAQRRIDIAMKWFWDWHTSFLSWHKQPWDLPGWPPE